MAVCFCSLLLFVACDGRGQGASFAPTPIPPILNPPSPPIGANAGHTLSGVVTASGLPLTGATVALLDFDKGLLIASTHTDGSGSYRLSEVKNVSSFSGALVSVSKPDYFTETRYVWMAGDGQSNFALARAVQVSLGEPARSRSVDARCASLGYGGNSGSVCERFVVTVPASGALEVTVSSRPIWPFDGTILNPDGTIGVYGTSTSMPLRLTLPVAAGFAYQIDVVPFGASEFEVTTALR